MAMALVDSEPMPPITSEGEADKSATEPMLPIPSDGEADKSATAGGPHSRRGSIEGEADRAATPFFKRRRASMSAEDEGWLELQSNVYSVGIAGLLKEMAYIPRDGADEADEVSKARKRRFRLLTSLSMVLLALGLQVFLVTKVKTMVCAKSVHYIREMYGEYQASMYKHTYTTVNGFARGKDLPNNFQPENFADLDDDFKEELCQIPLSQPDFLGVVLLIWTMRVTSEMRKCYRWANRFLVVTPTTTDWSKMITKSDGEDGLEKGLIAVWGIPLELKVAICILFLIQGGTASFLLWVGCRWLLATPEFADLILNGLALTFILEIKDMMYEDLLPTFFQQETELIRIKREPLPMSWRALSVPLGLLGLSIAWVYAYMYYLQQVLPGYKWDVKSSCHNFLTAHLLSV